MIFSRDQHPSDLLRPFLRGELSEQDAALVEAHLQTCPECRSERRALELLLADAPAMDDVERARLHRDVAEAEDATATTAAAPRRPSRLAPVMGAAATIVLLVAGVAWLATTLGDLDDAAEDAVPGSLDRDDSAEDAELGSEDEAAEALTERGAAAQADGGPAPAFHSNAGDLRPARLRRAGSSGNLFERFTSAYDTAAATPERRRTLLQSLARRAPDPDTRAQIRACAETVFSDPPGAVLPVFGATGRFEDRPALALGFVHAAEPGPLDRFMLWVWPDGECASILHYEAGRIRP